MPELSQERLAQVIPKDASDTIFALFRRATTVITTPTKSAAAGVTTVVQSIAASIPWSRVTGKPTKFPPTPHKHDQYLTEELDPVFTASPAHEVTQEEVDLLHDELDARAGWSGQWGYKWL